MVLMEGGKVPLLSFVLNEKGDGIFVVEHAFNALDPSSSSTPRLNHSRHFLFELTSHQ